MYFVKGLRHVQPYLDHCLTYPNTELIQAPHYMLTHIYQGGVYCVPNASIRIKRLRDIDNVVRRKTGVNWSFYGMKQADGLHRRLMLRGYEDEAICAEVNKAYPLSRWSKADVLAYVKAKKLPQPVNYGLKKQSSGLSFDPLVFEWLRSNYPDDLEMIYQAFPLSRQILFEYDAIPKV